MQHAGDRAIRLVFSLVPAALAVEVAKQLVGTINQVDYHLCELTPALRGAFSGNRGAWSRACTDPGLKSYRRANAAHDREG